MNQFDFELDRVESENGHEDYWFKVKGDSLKELDNNWMETGMVGVGGVIYSKDEDVVGIKRIFHFSYDVAISGDEKLKEILKELI